MCTTEIWTYTECACEYNRLISCLCSDDEDLDDRTRPRLPRQCSIVRTLKREFLEPICDECVVREQVDSENESLVRERSQLVWDSHVTVEIVDGQSEDERKTEDLDPGNSPDFDCTSRSEDDIDSSNPSTLDQPRLSTTTCDDADDEASIKTGRCSSSVFCVLPPNVTLRCHQRSRTREPRREGVDIPRDELCVSPRRRSREECTPEAYRLVRENTADEVVTKEAHQPFLPFCRRMLKDKVCGPWRQEMGVGLGRKLLHRLSPNKNRGEIRNKVETRWERIVLQLPRSRTIGDYPQKTLRRVSESDGD